MREGAMRYISKRQEQALFRHQTDELWVGEVHMTSKYHEIVPFSLDGERHVMIFTYPPYLNGHGVFSDQLMTTQDGGIFLPQRNHRMVDLLSVGSDGELKLMQDVKPQQVQNLAKTLYEITACYCKQNGFAAQLFFETTDALGAFIYNTLPAQDYVKSNISLRLHKELEAPFYGLSVSLKSII